ncbi:LacI family transcriptional regulator [Pseudoclavibacter endophyticus]|uniref:LacI family DNA-binding transcriptional regulator n=1 Tax=Pseudoclavibacter endophyticus TaxID=1778590 RepID=UPI0019B5C549|nr:substrate-binding domain-containing protein [Pseudoclavibacter endophyticus]GGA62363.1 LacI family transcriptional regulator [Pseudoclavibacter endophyticus]
MTTPSSRRPITQRGIAQLAEVSVTTVSRVLSSDGDESLQWASPGKVALIREIAELHGYRRNPHAASLRTARSNQIGVIVPRLQDYVLATIYEGIDEAATEQGISTFVTNSLDDVAKQRTRTQQMLDRRVDGIIFGDAHLDDPFLEELAEDGVPFVLTSRRKPPFVSVTCDDYEGGRLVGQHLIEIGRTDVLILAGLAFASTARDRTQGLVDRFREAGIDVPQDRIIFRGFDAAAGREATVEALAAGITPNAVFATNDFAAIGGLGVLISAGYSVPEDVALVGYNDTPLAESVGIPLTTIRSPMHEMGREALLRLTKLIAGEAQEATTLPPELLVRASTTVR